MGFILVEVEKKMTILYIKGVFCENVLPVDFVFYFFKNITNLQVAKVINL